MVSEGRTAHVMMDRRAIQHPEPRRPIRQQALALRRADRLAEVGLGMQAIVAFAAFGRIERNDVITHLEARHPLADLNDDTGPLMAQNGRENPFRVIARAGELVGMTQPRRLDLHQNLTRLRAVQLNLHDLQRFPGLNGHGSTCAHPTSSLHSGHATPTFGNRDAAICPQEYAGGAPVQTIHTLVGIGFAGQPPHARP
ncbi:hypothetical protein ROTO_23510 [Roseovarius tolerans]|uniref:Uncharacterized protein n=1 Tax=Roseovarius tolerans TaxID=74031 RepID=A0A0L6CTQ3_9RHOB|nr:hypothetical protein ROTO_23510 [Roseovarius tolerans]